MITQKELSASLQRPLYGDGGQKIGEARHVFYDEATGRPEWVTVKTGMLGGSESFVPVHNAVLEEGHLRVPYSKGMIKSSPNVDVDAEGHLSAKEEHRLYDFYGIDWDAELRQYTGEPQAEEQAVAETGIGTDIGTEAGPGAEADSLGDVLTLSEEKMHVHVERQATARARLRKVVETQEAQQTIPLRHEEVHLVREPITEQDRGDALSGAQISEAERIVTLHEEKPVVETTVEPVERVRLEIEEKTEQQTIRGRIRKEKIKLEDGGDYEQHD